MSKAMQWTFMGCEHLETGNGGIPTLARMTARALLEAGADLELHALLDKAPVNINGQLSSTSRGSRLSYLLRCHQAAFTRRRFIYDTVGTARAHPRFFPLRRPYAVWINGTDVWYNLHSDRARALRGADLVLAISQFTLNKFEQIHWPLPTARICPLGTQEDAPPLVPPDFAGPPTAVILGRIDAGEGLKGHKELIECWPRVIAAVPEAQLLIAGGGSGLAMIREKAAASPVATNIDVKGFVPDAVLSELWRQAHVFAMPSRQEGFGIVYAEAMRHGLPVIASVHDAGQEVNADGETGYNVDLDRPDELPMRLIELLGDVSKARAMGQAAYERWDERYRYSAFVKRLMDTLNPFLI